MTIWTITQNIIYKDNVSHYILTKSYTNYCLGRPVGMVFTLQLKNNEVKYRLTKFVPAEVLNEKCSIIKIKHHQKIKSINFSKSCLKENLG